MAAPIWSEGGNTFTVTPAGGTKAGFIVDVSVASCATGWQVKGAAAASGAALAVISGGTNEGGTVDAKGSGQLIVAATSTGLVSIGRGAASVPILSNTKTAIATQNSTPTAAQLLGGYIAHASVTGAGTATLDTAAHIDTAIPGAVVGDQFTCVYANTGNQTVTITTAAGLTLIGTVAVPTHINAILTFVKTGTATYDVLINLSA